LQQLCDGSSIQLRSKHDDEPWFVSASHLPDRGFNFNNSLKTFDVPFIFLNEALKNIEDFPGFLTYTFPDPQFSNCLILKPHLSIL